MANKNKRTSLLGRTVARVVLGKRQKGDMSYYKMANRIARRVDEFITDLLLAVVVGGAYAYIFASALLR